MQRAAYVAFVASVLIFEDVMDTFTEKTLVTLLLTAYTLLQMASNQTLFGIFPLLKALRTGFLE
ncbi:hypothetical protein MAR_006692 [Mya arenaria]|uniref:Uncharacterized protein n=1 Tax=Mya arenaria TaxID=6604 RepID=A0ABY7DCA5_MYAAR|nr:hypothetical protein MAR_006692 [Mya arenaria]